jgi:hypothetical protein
MKYKHRPTNEKNYHKNIIYHFMKHQLKKILISTKFFKKYAKMLMQKNIKDMKTIKYIDKVVLICIKKKFLTNKTMLILKIIQNKLLKRKNVVAEFI